MVAMTNACAAVGCAFFVDLGSSIPSLAKQSFMALSISSSVIFTFSTSILIGLRRDSEGLAWARGVLAKGCRIADVIAVRMKQMALFVNLVDLLYLVGVLICFIDC